MPRKKATKSIKNKSDYKNRARLLKKNKLIDYDLRRKLTPQQKAAITKQWGGKTTADEQSHHNGFGHLIQNEQVTRRVVSQKRANQLKELGYPVHGRSVFIDKEGYDSVHIKGNTIIKRNEEKEEKDYLISHENILKHLKRLVKRKLKPNETVTVRIGDYSPFRTVLHSYESLLNYVSNWQPRKDFAARDDLIAQMSIVRFTKNI